MTKIKIPYINPIRFRPITTVSTIPSENLPRIDKMANGVDYQRGVYPLKNYKQSWLTKGEISLQLKIDRLLGNNESIDLVAIQPNGVPLSLYDGIPLEVGSETILTYAFNPSQIGDYYFYTKNVGSLNAEVHYISDIINVRENNQDLVEIAYSDTLNNLDGYFYDSNGNAIWQPKIYHTGLATPGEPKTSYDIYRDDPDVPSRTNSEIQDTIDLILTDITNLENKKAARIFACNTIAINSQPVLNEEPPEWEVTEKSDGIDIKANFTQTENDGCVKNY